MQRAVACQRALSAARGFPSTRSRSPGPAPAARAAAKTAFTALLLALGAVALLVGGLGIAEVMVIAVMGRRGEIGLRRALGGTRGHILLQFLAEVLLLSLLGGTAGLAAAWLLTTAYAH